MCRSRFRIHHRAAQCTLVAMAVCVTFARPAEGQEDVIAQARAAVSDGRRDNGLELLATHLASTPRDVDARFVYGLILSWEGRYDEARSALDAVLAQAPGYLDARVALMNVEWWSGRLDQARARVHEVLEQDAGNQQARLVLQRLDARTRPWSFGFGATRDVFKDTFNPWTESAFSLSRATPVGSVIGRFSRANRFGYTDGLSEIEFYPNFRAGTYAFVGVGFGKDEAFYPKSRVSFDLYQSLGHGFEVSGGYRALMFSETTHIYLGTLTRYVGDWMITGKVYRVPDERVGASWSMHGVLRRYFGSQGTSFVGGGYSYGFGREEPRGTGDLVRLDANTIRAQVQIDLSEWAQVSGSASSGRQMRLTRDPQWQTTFGTGFTFRF